MSHELRNASDMAFKGETPWHGLGIQVPPNATGIEMLKAAHMEWLVQRRKLAMRATDGVQLLTDPLNALRVGRWDSTITL